MSDLSIVLDANIAIKLLHQEADSDTALEFLQTCTNKDTHILVPEHFLYELVNVCHRLGIETANALKLFSAMQGSILTITAPKHSTWLLAEKIANAGHPKSGFASMYDSIYHALAIEHQAVFVTADKKHYAKAGQYSNICLLSEWRSIFVAED